MLGGSGEQSIQLRNRDEVLILNVLEPIHPFKVKWLKLVAFQKTTFNNIALFENKSISKNRPIGRTG